MTRPTRFYGWKLVAVLWLVLVTALATPLYGASIINTYMIKDLGLDRSGLGSISGIFLWVSGLPGPLVALLMNKKGIRNVMLGGTSLVALGAVLMATVVSSSFEYGLVYCTIVALGVVSCGPIGAQAAITRWFNRHRGRAIALVLTAPTVGGFIAPTLLQRLIGAADGNWRIGWWFIAGSCSIAMLLVALFVKDDPAALGQHPDGSFELVPAHAEPERHAPSDWSVREVLRTPTFWLLWACPMGIYGGYSMYLAHGALQVESLGYSLETGAATLSLMLVFVLVGNLLFALIGGRVPPRLLMAASGVAFGSGLLLALHATGGPFVYPPLLGLGFGLSFSSLMSMIADYFGRKAYAVLIGVMLAGQTSWGAIGDYTAGRLHDAYGTYSGVLVGIAVLCFAGAAVWPFVTPAARRERSDTAPVAEPQRV
ncbi:MFS transporter [Streptomyces sp. NPDC090493]|uniref:MFS transporter n=1 Tax=Streptomyces sp. NPDC090493 TaxID=3365964 RepID=UPI003830D47B